MKYGFLESGTTVWAVGWQGVFDAEEDLIEGDVASVKLGEQACLIPLQLINDLDIIW